MKDVIMSKEKVNICVPITGDTEDKIIETVKKVNADSVADMMEWRVDHFAEAGKVESVLSVLKKIKAINKKPLLFTYRTKAEGGQGPLKTVPEYMMLVKMAVLSKLVDIVDVEFLLGDAVLKSIREHARMSGVMLLVSNHDFDSTPRQEIVVNRLHKMASTGADIVKVAYMPKTEEDVETLINVCKEAHDIEAYKVVISMGEQGKKTRLMAKELGCCMTFAQMEEASAPGQITLEEAKTMK